MNNPAAYINFIESNEPIDSPITKFGGNPVWLEKPLWPVSRSTGNPMRFICQIAIDKSLFPDAQGRIAYIFMTDEEEYVDGTWDSESGENAVIIQPSNILEHEVKDITTGPTLEAEYNVELKKANDLSISKLDEMLLNDEEGYHEALELMEGSKIGGTPVFVQGEEFPDGDDWLLLLQLASTQAPFFVNFGDCGTAYVFINKSGDKGKFLWQAA